MSDSRYSSQESACLWRPLGVLAALFVVASCGGGGDASQPSFDPPVQQAPTPTSGTLGVLLTDAPTDRFAEINVNITEVTLIGDDEGQQTIFSGSKRVNLLDLRNYNEPIAFDEVAVGSYSKLRLRIDELELVFHESEQRPNVYPAILANGKIDLLDRDGFEILPGRTLLAEIDMDVDKSIKVTGTGNGKYLFRPVVMVDFMDGGEMPDKLTRLEGTVDEFGDAEGEFELCSTVIVDNCIDVFTGAGTSFFGADGLPADFSAVEPGSPVVVIGRYRDEGEEDDDGENGVDIDLEFDAIVVEVGGNSSQVAGNVVSAPAESRFLIVQPGSEAEMIDPAPLAVDLQEGTRVFSASEEVDESAIVIGSEVEVEGVLVTPEGETDPANILAAIIFVAPEARDRLSGEVSNIIDDGDTRGFDLSNDDGTFCVALTAEAAIIDVNTDTAEITTNATFDVVADGKTVDAFGAAADPEVEGACFMAEEIIVETTTMP